MSAGDRYTARKLKAMRTQTRDSTRRFDQQGDLPAGWYQNQVMREGAKAGLLENVMRQWINRPTRLEQPDPTVTNVPAWPLCTTALRRR